MSKPQTEDGPTAELPRWLSVEQIRKMQRVRREVVLAAMASSRLPFERRGRVRYARRCDVLAWEESRLQKGPPATVGLAVHPALAGLL